MCDDAFITVRAVDNLFHGHYFAYNGDERVQAFTNPLWALMLVVGLATPRLRPTAFSLVIAMLLYAAYVVSIGGDFMSGRLWTPVLTLAMVLIVRFSDVWINSSTKLWAASTTAAVLALCSPFMPLRDDPSQETNKVPPSGVANERAWYQDLAAWKNVRVKAWHAQGFYLEGLRAAATKSRVHVFGYIGQFGMALGPEVHVIDDLALADALLARITFKPRSTWRIGHYKRDVPPGYIDSVKTGQNLIVDKCVHEYFEDLREVTYGNIWSLKRWGAIWRLNQPKNLTVKFCPS